MFLRLLNFDCTKVLKYYDVRDDLGRFASMGLNHPDFTDTDRKIIDLKPERRPLTDRNNIRSLASIVPGSDYIPYTKLPFFNTLMEMQGTNIDQHSGAEQKAARDVLLAKQPVREVSIADMTFTQNVVHMGAVENFKAVGAKPVQVASYQGQMYLLDGHHRVAYEALHGAKTIDAHVLDLKRKLNFDAVLKFNPNHDPENGRFMSGDGGGPGIEFVSPNVSEGLDVGSAQAALSSPRHYEVLAASEEVDRLLGLDSVHESAVGAWSDGAENTLLGRVYGNPSYEQVKLSAAMKGMLADQKAVIPFKEGEGPDSLYQIKMRGTNLKQVHDDLLAAGLEFHTLVPSGDHTNAYVFDPGTELTTKVQEAGAKHGIEISQWRGRGEFLGSWDTRDEGRQAYQAVIDANLGQDRQAAWDGLYSRWREKHPLIKADLSWVLKYNYNHHPAGTPGGKGGQFAPKGTEGSVEERFPERARVLAAKHNKVVGDRDIFEQIKKRFGQEGLDRINVMQARLNELRDQKILNTKDIYYNKKSHRWTREREALHKDVLDDLFKKMDQFKAKEGETPLLTVLGGRGGSGKGFFKRVFNQPGDVQQFHLDPDELKKTLGEMAAKAGFKEGWNPAEAARWHEEGDRIFEAAVKYARVNKINVILDITLKSDKAQWLHSFREAGFDAQGGYMFLHPEEAALRAAKRALEGDRYVPAHVIVGQKDSNGKHDGQGNYNNERNFDRLIKRVFNKGYIIYQNMGSSPELVEDARVRKKP